MEAGGRRGAFSLTSVTDDAATDKRLLKRICGKRLESGRVFVRLEALGVAAKVQPQGGAPRATPSASPNVSGFCLVGHLACEPALQYLAEYI